MAPMNCFFATLSPLANFAGTRFDAIAVRHGATVACMPVDILRLFARSGGAPPQGRHPNRQTWRAPGPTRLARKTGLPFTLNPAHWPTNASPSACAVISARRARGGDPRRPLHAFPGACRAEHKAVAEEGVIRAGRAGTGPDPGPADRGLWPAAETHARNLGAAVDKGAFGVPSCAVDSGQPFCGQTRLEGLDAHLAGQL